MSEPEHPENLREQAHERVAEMPAETALGNRDPQGGGQGEPTDYESQTDQK